MEELEKQLAGLMKECAVLSGLPGYTALDMRRKSILRQIEAMRTLKREEFISLYGYANWLVRCDYYGLPENHPVAAMSSV